MPAPAERVWHPVVRVVHWSVAALVFIDLVNEAGANPWHRYFGYAAAALVITRLGWGLSDSGPAGLAGMMRCAASILRYVRGRHSGYAAHNPLGAAMAFTLWGLVVITATTGWLLQLEQFWGDETVEALHTWTAYGLGACALVHVAGVIFTSVRLRTNLVKAMVTGERETPQSR